MVDSTLSPLPVFDTNPSPIAVFDSGVGGLSILRALRQQLPHENFLYFADSRHAPYGEKDEQWVHNRTLEVAHELFDQGAKALVVACNTATAAAVASLRHNYPNIPFIGVEPAIKPAAQHSTTRYIGVLATQRTLASAKFKSAVDELSNDIRLRVWPATGLALAIETGDTKKIEQLLTHHLQALAPFGDGPGQVDTLVLGCTHYPFVRDRIQQIVGEKVHIVDNGDAVARHTSAVLERLGLLNTQKNVGSLVLQASAQLVQLTQFSQKTLA